MKKSTFLKSTMALAFAVVSLGAFAQVHDANVSMSVDYAGAEGVHVEYVTNNMPYPYIAKPDPLYHPTYGAGVNTLTAGFTWDWNVTGKTLGTEYVLLTPTPAATTLNMRHIIWKETGDQELTVAEKAPAAWGGCTDATPTKLNIKVVDGPSIALGNILAGFSDDDIVAASAGDEKVHYSCGAYTSKIDAKLTGYGKSYKVKYDIKKYHYKPDGTFELKDAAFKVVASEDLGSVPTGADLVNPVAEAAINYNLNGDAAIDFVFHQEGGKDVRTVYIIRLYEGVRDLLTVKSDDYYSNVSWRNVNVAAGADTDDGSYLKAYVVLNPAPETGPIYHLPNA